MQGSCAIYAVTPAEKRLVQTEKRLGTRGQTKEIRSHSGFRTASCVADGSFALIPESRELRRIPRYTLPLGRMRASREFQE